MNAKEVKVYSTTTCPYCIMEKQWLEANKVPHKVVYVDQDQKEAMNMIKNTGQMGVPVTELTLGDGKVKYVVGFDQVELKKVIGF